MKDFDTERRERHAEREKEMGDRSFILSGKTFVYRANASYTVLEQIAATNDADGGDLIRAMEQSVLELLEPGQEDEFLATIRSKDDPYTFADLNELAEWLTEAQVKRPTLAPLPSTGGDATTPISSTDDSSSKPAEASAA